MKPKNNWEEKIIMANSTLEIFETNNFGLETFIHVHDIRYESSYKDEFGTRYWRYLRTPRLDEVINEYKQIVADRKRREQGNVQAG